MMWQVSLEKSFATLVMMILLLSLGHNTPEAQSLVPDYVVVNMAANGDKTNFAVLGHTEQNSLAETIYFVDLLDASLHITNSIEIGTNLPNFLEISSDGRWIAFNVPYLELKVIDTVTQEVHTLYGGGPIEVDAIDWNPVDGRLAYSVGATVSIAQAYGNQPQGVLQDEVSPGLIADIAWSNDGLDIATMTSFASRNDPFNRVTNIQIWHGQDFMTSSFLTTPASRFPGGSGYLAWNPANDRIADVQENGIAIYEIVSGTSFSLVTPSGETPASIAWSPDGTQIAAGGLNNIWIWDIVSGEVVNTVAVDGLVSTLIWSPTLGLIHNGDGNGLFIEGNLVTAPRNQEINSLSLLDATGFTIQDMLVNNAVIDLATVTASPLRFRANSSPATVGSVRFELSGSATASFTDNSQPYEMDWTPTVGSYTLTATPYSGADGTGTAGTPYTINFSTTYSAAITNISLVDPSTGTVITGFEALENNDVIDLTTMTISPVHITANLNASVGSVKFILDGASPQNDNAAPYQLENWIPTPGQHTLTVTLHSGANGTGNPSTPVNINFNVITKVATTGFILLDASGVPVTGFDPLEDNAVINLDTVTSSPLKLRATFNTQTVGSVKFELNGQVVFTDNAAPYEYDWTPSVGLYTLKATPYYGADGTGEAGTPLEIDFSAVKNLAIVSYSLIDPSTNQVIEGYENLSNGTDLDYSVLNVPNLIVRANTYPENVGSVRFTYQPPNTAIIYQETDNTAPYEYVLQGAPFSAQAYSGANHTGTAGTARSLSLDISQTVCHPNALLYTYTTSPATHDLFSLTVSGGHSMRLSTTDIGSETSPQCSPLANAIVFASDEDGDYEIFTSAPDGGDGHGESSRVRLTNNTSADRFPVWSPDGSKIAFASIRSGNWEIYVMDANGSNLFRLTTNSAMDLYPAWSPDGTKIAFQSDRAGNNELYVMNADGTSLMRLTNRSVSDVRPNWSPDGSRILFISKTSTSAANDIYVMNADGTNIQRLTMDTAIDDFADWSPDGTEIVFISTRSDPNKQLYDIFLMNADGSNLRQLTATSSYSESTPSWNYP